MEGYKQHKIFLPNSINNKALKLKKKLELKSINDLIIHLIKNANL